MNAHPYRVLERATSLIDGQPVAARADGHDLPVINPTSEQRVSWLREADAREVDAAVASARRAFDSGPWPRITLDERKDILYRIRDAIRAHQDELAYLECLHAGLPISRVREQIGRAARNFEFFAEVASTMKGETYTGLAGYLTYVTREPKGVGALVVRSEPRLGLVPLLHGGGQERSLRPGTLPTHQIVGMGAACRIAASEMSGESARVADLRGVLWRGLEAIGGISLNGHPTQRAPGILNVTVEGVEGESLLFELPELAIASGSACATTTAEPSYVLRSLGRSDRLAQSSLRLSLGRFTTAAEIDRAIAAIAAAVGRLRGLFPADGAA